MNNKLRRISSDFQMDDSMVVDNPNLDDTQLSDQIRDDMLQILKNEMRERHTKKLHDKLNALEDSSNESLKFMKYSTRSMEDLT